MAQQETGGGTGEPSLTEEVQAQPETTNEAGTETPALSTSLNRAERRAQAKGKKAGAGGANAGLPLSGGMRGPNPRTTGAVTPVRVNRSGSRSK
jgi:hypothetical protein